MILVLILGWVLFHPQVVRAVQLIKYRVCMTGTVGIEGFNFPSLECWMEIDYLEDPYDPPPESDPVPWGDWHPPYYPPPSRPDSACVEARVNQYGHFKRFNTNVVYDSLWGFVTRSEPRKYYFDPGSMRAPPGYTWMLGRYDPQLPNPSDGGVIHIYYGAYSTLWNNPNVRLFYDDPQTGEHLFLRGPIRPDEMLTIVLQHELGHAAHSNVSEDKLNGYGVEALKAYRNDPTADDCR